MAEDEKKVAVIICLFQKANKHYVCPGCLKAYSRFNVLTNHLKREKNEIHEGLMAERQSDFDYSYRRLIGREDENDKFVVPSSRAAACEIRFFVQHRLLKPSHPVLSPPHPVVSRMQLLLKIAVASGMKFVCPQCVDKDFEYFNNMTEFGVHCRQKGDQTHTNLMSTVDGTFFPSYLRAMKRDKVVDPLDGNSRKGPPSFLEYLKIGYVFQEKFFGTAPEETS